NVLDKLVADGIVAKYIIREDDQGVTDFEYLYRPIAIFFSFLVRLGREFRDFKDNDFLIDQYLTQHGHYTSGNESLVELAWSVENLLRRRSHRGSLKSIEKVDQINVVPTRPNG